MINIQRLLAQVQVGGDVFLSCIFVYRTLHLSGQVHNNLGTRGPGLTLISFIVRDIR